MPIHGLARHPKQSLGHPKAPGILVTLDPVLQQVIGT